MTEAYHEFLAYLKGLGQNGENRLLISWKKGHENPVLETTTIIRGGLSLENLDLGLSGMAQLALYDETNRTGFSIVDEKGDKFQHAVDFSHNGFSTPKLRNQGLVQETLGGPKEVVARVVTDHIAYLLGNAEAAKPLVKTYKKSVVVANKFKLELSPGRDIHGELRLKK